MNLDTTGSWPSGHSASVTLHKYVHRVSECRPLLPSEDGGMLGKCVQKASLASRKTILVFSISYMKFTLMETWNYKDIKA